MDPKGKWWMAVGAVVVLLVAGGIIYSAQKGKGGKTNPVPSVGTVSQLPLEDQPQIELAFSSDGHYVTVNISNLHADQVEYNLIYDASVKNSKLNTGVNAAASVANKETYSQKQLLGSESSGKFTYHEDISGALMELTLRDEDGRSIFTATYPFEVVPGESVSLSAST